MDFQKLFEGLGRGFGIVQAMATVTRQIESIRRKVEEGLLSEDESLREEEAWMQKLNRFYLDPRWGDIDAANRAGRREEAKAKAAELRAEHGL